MRYEHGGRFWSVARSGAVLTITSGKLGNKGRTVTKTFANEDAAKAAERELVLEKQREGYRIAEDEAKPPQAEPEIHDERGAGLEAAIVENPDDVNAFAVYGDWLQRHGDPRGELIALQHAAAAATPRPGTKSPATTAVGKHIALHAERLLGRLAPLVKDVRDPDSPPFIWRNGFIYRAEIQTTKGRPVDATLGALLEHPSAKFLTELAVRADDRKEALAVLDLVKRAPPTLREFDLFARANLDRVHATWPKLHRLGITARAYELATLDAPELRRAKFLATSISSATVKTVVTAPWPVLERLEIRFCANMGATEADFHDLRPLLLRTDMPALTHLRLRGCPFAGAVARTLAASPLAPQLHVLDFSAGDFSPQDLSLLAAHANNFPNLRELWLPFNYVNANVEKMLAPVAKRVIPDSRGPTDTLDYDLAGETVPRGESRYGGTRE